MLKVIVLAALVAAAAAFVLPEENFSVWKFVHQKKYDSAEEEAARKTVWEQNMQYVKDFKANNPDATFEVAMNEYGDLTGDEFATLYLSQSPYVHQPAPATYEPTNAELADHVDWRDKGYVTGVKNQGQCGSCWSFSTTGSLEGQHFKATGNLVSLSEQNLVDCSGAEGNQGCNGGLMDQAFAYIKKNNGIDTEASYPYTARDGSCKFKASDVGATLSSWKDVSQGSETDLQDAVANVGPVSVAIDASHSSFQFYSSGVYNEPACSSTQLDHGVLAVGYGTTSGQDYWIVKNSWGASWGNQGYIWMSRNKNNQCGIATAASYPIV